jgi:hypothetical protein
MMEDIAAVVNDTRAPMPATVAGYSARRYAHLSVIDGGKS